MHAQPYRERNTQCLEIKVPADPIKHCLQNENRSCKSTPTNCNEGPRDFI